MRIGIDARELCGHPTGVGRYLAGLLQAWSRSPDASQHEFLLYSPERLRRFTTAPFTARPVPGGGTVWEQWHLARAAAGDRLDRFFSPGYTSPLLLKIPTVVAIHDVSFAAHPEWFMWREGLRRRTLSRASARRARAVVTISEFSRGEIVRLFGVDPARIKVIPPGIDLPEHATRATLTSPQSLAPNRSVLYVGSIFNRRNIPQLIAAVTELKKTRPDTSLDIVGDNRTHPHIDVQGSVSALGPDTVRWHRYVSDAELEHLYTTAGAFAFLSEYEGLGLTPLEAMGRGVPAVLLDTPIARESCGDAALYVNSEDAGSLVVALDRLLHDASVRGRLLAAAPQVLARYDWTRAAQATLTLITGAA